MIRRVTWGASLAGGTLSVAACGWFLPDGDLEASPNVDASADAGELADVSVLLDSAPQTADSSSKQCTASQRFGAPTSLGLKANARLRLSPDELSGFYSVDGAIYRVTRSSLKQPFSPTQVVSAEAGVHNWPTVTADGKTMFADDNNQLIVAQIAEDGTIGPFTNIKPPSPATLWVSPFVTGNFVYVTLAVGDVLQVNRFELKDNVLDYVARPATAPDFGAPNWNGYVVTTSDQRIGYFASRRDTADGGSAGNAQIWVTEAFDEATSRRVEELEDFATENIPMWLSPDGCRLYFQQGTKASVAEKISDAGP